MAIAIRAYQPEDVPALVEIWNEVVEQGIAFPQKAPLTNQIGAAFFAKQSCTAAAYDTETAEIVGMYILHPNNVGRCGHICNASYAVKATYRGQKIGEQLAALPASSPSDGIPHLAIQCGCKGKLCSKETVRKAGFVTIGTIPGGLSEERRNVFRYCLVLFSTAKRTDCRSESSILWKLWVAF